MKVSEYIKQYGLKSFESKYPTMTGVYTATGKAIEQAPPLSTLQTYEEYRAGIETGTLKNSNGALKDHAGYYEVVAGVWAQTTPLTASQMTGGTEQATIGGVSVQLPTELPTGVIKESWWTKDVTLRDIYKNVVGEAEPKTFTEQITGIIPWVVAGVIAVVALKIIK